MRFEDSTYPVIADAAAAFNDSAFPGIGIFTRRVHLADVSSVKPRPSLPIRYAAGSLISASLRSSPSDPNRLDFMALDSGLSKVGVFGIRRESESSDEAEVSYILAPEFYGRGFATEGVKWIMGYCKEHWGISNVIAEIHKENIRSINLAESVGFKESENRGVFIRFSKCL